MLPNTYLCYDYLLRLSYSSGKHEPKNEPLEIASSRNIEDLVATTKKIRTQGPR